MQNAYFYYRNCTSNTSDSSPNKVESESPMPAFVYKNTRSIFLCLSKTTPMCSTLQGKVKKFR